MTLRPRARRFATFALALDATAVGLLIVAMPRAVTVIVAIALLALGGIAVRWPRVGLVTLLTRGLLATVCLIAVIVQPFMLIGFATAAGAALVGLHGALGPRDLPSKSALDPEASPRDKRRDELGSAIIYLGFIGLIAGALVAEGRFLAALGFVAYWAAATWGILAVHELGHAVATRTFRMRVTEFRVGIGLTIFRRGVVVVGAIPCFGHVHWASNDAMTSRRHAWIALAGPVANLAVAGILLAMPAVRAEGLGLMLVALHVLAGIGNLVPASARLPDGREVRSDGVWARILLGCDRVDA